MRTEGSTVVGGTYPDTHPSLPRAGESLGHGHRPWCQDCKRKHDATDLDNHGRCARCARAAASKAAAAERRAHDAEAQWVWNQALREHQGKAPREPRPRVSTAGFDVDAAMARYAAGDPVKDIAADVGCSVSNIQSHAHKRGVRHGSRTPQEPPKEGKQGQPTTRSSAPRARQASSSTGRAPVARPSTHREQDPPAARETRPAAAGGPPNPALAPLHAARAVLARDLDAIAQAIVDLDRIIADLTPPAPQATAGPAEPPQPAGTTTPPSRRVMGDWTDTPKRRAPSTRWKDVDEQAIIREYQAGDTPPAIARRHSIGPARVRNILDRHGIERRDDRTHSGGQNRRTFTDIEMADIKRLYLDEHLSTTTIGQRLDVDRRVIRKALVDNGVPLRPAAHQTGGTTLTSDQLDEIVRLYQAGEQSMAQIGQRFNVRAERVRATLVDRGIPIRPKGGSHRNGQLIANLGVTARDIKVWAVETGYAETITTGLVPRALIDAYAAAHPPEQEATG